MPEETPDETPSAPDGWVDESVETSWESEGAADPDDAETPVEPDDSAADVTAEETLVDDGPDEDQHEEPDEHEEPTRPVRAAWEPTGHDSVDRVLASLDVLDEACVHDHVAVFEEAHRALRRTLDEAHDEPAAGLG